MELLNIVYCLAELTEFAAFIHLRVRAPHLRRPFRVGLPTWGCVLMLTPATMLLLTLIVQPILDLDFMVRSLSIAKMDKTLLAFVTRALVTAWQARCNKPQAGPGIDCALRHSIQPNASY